MNTYGPVDEVKTLLDMSHVAESAGLRHHEPTRLRFGEVAVALGYVHEIEVDAALAIQRLDAITGRRHRMVGEILVDRGSLTHAQVSEVLDSLVTHVRRRRVPVGAPLIGPIAV